MCLDVLRTCVWMHYMCVDALHVCGCTTCVWMYYMCVGVLHVWMYYMGLDALNGFAFPFYLFPFSFV